MQMPMRSLTMLLGLSLWLPVLYCSAQDLVYIDTSFENASPLSYDASDPALIRVFLNYDSERNSPNRAAGHWHFRVEAKPGSTIPIELNHFYNVWNGTPGFPISDKTITYYSDDGSHWRPAETELADTKDRLTLQVPVGSSGSVFVARLPAYRLSDLDKWLKRLEGQPNVQIEEIGRTVQGRPLEIIRVGKVDAKYRVFMRARAHPWEPGGNWVLEGLVDRMLTELRDDTSKLNDLCFYVLPMANKDGVAMGRTRFNAMGVDLNRGWAVTADPKLCPENHALERWLVKVIEQNRRPHFAVELHNDESGRLHIGRPKGMALDDYLGRMTRFEKLLTEHSWFREGSTGSEFANPGTLGEGWLPRFGIDSVVHELNANWIAGVNDYPTEDHWRRYGADLCQVFRLYFD